MRIVSVVAVLTACAGMSEIVVSGECNHYILIYVSSGMKSNTPPHPRMSPNPSTILLKGSQGSGFVNPFVSISVLGQWTTVKVLSSTRCYTMYVLHSRTWRKINK
jgi:hypothetical protein